MRVPRIFTRLSSEQSNSAQTKVGQFEVAVLVDKEIVRFEVTSMRSARA
jgi:hypothetical protein